MYHRFEILTCPCPKEKPFQCISMVEQATIHPCLYFISTDANYSFPPPQLIIIILKRWLSKPHKVNDDTTPAHILIKQQYRKLHFGT
mmetsp:Transcript_18984/g.23541  ORF Transcript_18984/g.23541 Transcript_18984/m.23541 type:complete len:87 (+) Transcript_18984:425-685(+)